MAKSGDDLVEAVKSYPLFTGPMENVDRRMVPDGRPVAITNGMHDKEGVVKKRLGWKQVVDPQLGQTGLFSPTLHQPLGRIFPFKDELCWADGHWLWGRVLSTTSNRFALKSEHHNIPVERQEVMVGPDDIHDADCVVADAAGTTNLLVQAYSIYDEANHTGGGDVFPLYLAVIDLQTDSVVYRAMPFADNGKWTQVRTVTANSLVIILAYNLADGFIWAWKWDPTAPDTAPVSIITNVTAGTMVPKYPEQWDAVGNVGSDFAVIYYHIVDEGNSDVYIRKWDVAGTLLGTAIQLGGTGVVRSCAIDWDGSDFYGVYYRSFSPSVTPDLYVWKVNSALTVTAYNVVHAAAVIHTAAAQGHWRVCVKIISGSGAGMVWWQEHQTAGPALYDSLICQGFLASSGSNAGYNKTIQQNRSLLARPFVDNNRAVYFTEHSYTTGVMTSILGHAFEINNVALSGHRLCSVVNYMNTWNSQQNAGGANALMLPPRWTSPDSKGRYWFCAQDVVNIDSGGLSLAQQIDRKWPMYGAVLTIDPSPGDQYAELSDFTALSGGVPSHYDGQEPEEMGYALRPEIINTNQTTTGGGLGAVQYSWVITMVSWDRYGNEHISEPSFVHTETIVAPSDTITFYVSLPPTNRADDRASRRIAPKLRLYRANATSNDYVLVSETSTRTLDSQAHIQTVIDNSSSGVSGEQLYTGGEAENTGAPTMKSIVEAQGRLWGISTENPSIVYFTKPLVFGRGPEWSVFTFQLRCPETVVALGNLTGRTVLFCKRSIYLVEGPGLAADGRTGYYAMRKINSDVGCVDESQIVSTPKGIIFRADRTFMLLTTGLTLANIGAAIEDTARSFPVGIQATVDKDRNCARFFVGTDDEGGNLRRELIYNWELDRWSVSVINLPDGAQGYIQSACKVGSSYFLLKGTRLYEELEGWYHDEQLEYPAPDDFYPLIIETQEYKGVAEEGFNRLWWTWFTLRWMEAHGIQIDISYDGDSSFPGMYQFWFSESQVDAMKYADDSERIRLHMKRQVFSSVRFKIQDTPPAGGLGTAGYEARMLTLQMGVDPRLGGKLNQENTDGG